MKTSLLNRAQSPIPSADSTPQTTAISTPETTSGFAGLFQKAIGWLSPKTPTTDTASDGTTSDYSLLPTGEHQPNFTLDTEISINHDTANAPKMNGENIAQEESSIVTIKSSLTENNLPLNSALNLTKADSSVDSTTNQIDGELSEFKITNNGNLIQDKNSKVAVVVSPESKKINQIALQETQHDNKSISENEHPENIKTQPSLASDSPIHLDDVVASVYAAIQTNISTENSDITFKSSGKNSAEITLILPKKSIETKEITTAQTTDTHQLLETLSLHIDAIQKTLGNAVTVKFGIVQPNEIVSELSENEEVNDGSSVKNETPNTNLKMEQDEFTTDSMIISNNLIAGVVSSKQQTYDVVIDQTQYSEKSNSAKIITDKELDKKDVPTDISIGQDTLARIASVLTKTTVNVPVEPNIVGVNEAGEVNTPNIPTEIMVTSKEKQQRNDKQTKEVPVELKTETTPDTIPASKITGDTFQHTAQFSVAIPDATSTNILNNSSTKHTNLTTEVLPAILLENTEEIPYVIPSLTQEFSPENTENISKGLVINGLQATLKADIPTIPNGISSQFHNSTGISASKNTDENQIKADKQGNTLQAKIDTQTTNNESKEAVSQPKVISNSQKDNGDLTTIIPEKNQTIEEIQKQSFNSVRELLDASSKNGITVNSLVIRVETPNVEIPKEFAKIVDTSTVGKKDVSANQVDTTTNKPNLILQSDQITDQFDNNVENTDEPTIEVLNTAKNTDGVKVISPQINVLKAEVPKETSTPKETEVQLNAKNIDVSNVKTQQSKTVESDAPKGEVISSDIEKMEVSNVRINQPDFETSSKAVELETPNAESISTQSINVKTSNADNSSKAVELETPNAEPISTQIINTKIPKVETSGKAVELETPNAEHISTQSINTKIPKVETSSKTVELETPNAEPISTQVIKTNTPTVEIKANAVKVESQQVENATPKVVLSDISKAETTGITVKNEFPNVENKISESKELNVSKNETDKSEVKIISPKIETTKASTITVDSPLRETNQEVTPKVAPEMALPTIKAQDFSAVASTQKPIVASKTEPKIEKKVAKIDSIGEVVSTPLTEQMPVGIKNEQNTTPQNNGQKQDEKQKSIVNSVKFESSLSNEVQENESVSSNESISNADVIRAKSTIESNNNTQSTANLFQAVSTPISKNYNSLDVPKKSVPRVNIDDFAPATAQLVRSLPQQTGGSVRMQLTPDALGPVTVQVNVRDKNAMLRIDVDTTAAKQALEAQIPLLREQLSQQGITSERIEIQVRPREDFSMFSGFNQQNSSARQEEQQARQSYLRSFADGRDDRQETVAQDILPKVKEKKAVVKNRVEFYA